MFIIDFDDTLFDTHIFKHARLEALKKLGISEEMYWETYKQARSDKAGNFTYSDEMHAKTISDMGFDKQKVLSVLNGITSRFEDFLFSDAKDFLEALKKFSQPMVLLTHGDYGFQDFKIKGTGIDKYFDKVFITTEPKEKIMEEILKMAPNENVWFINDKVEETIFFYKKFPQLRPILKVSDSIPKNEYLNSQIPHFANLIDIVNYIKKY